MSEKNENDNEQDAPQVDAAAVARLRKAEKKLKDGQKASLSIHGNVIIDN